MLSIQRIVNNHKKDTIVIRIKDPIEDIKAIKSIALSSGKISGLLKFEPRLKTLEKKTIL